MKSTSEVPYFTDGKTCYVKVGVTVEGREEIELLPVMDLKNNAVGISTITMTAVNKAIQRAFVKACARHGLGLYVYAGEDLPSAERRGPVVIDYNAAAQAAESADIMGLTQEVFAQQQQSVIDTLMKEEVPAEALTNIMNYITNELQGKRLSVLEYDQDKVVLNKIYNYISFIKNALNG